MNRAQRRAQAKQIPSYRRGMTKEEKMKALFKNGITSEDLEQEWNRGYRAGLADAGVPVFKQAYAAACLTLHEQFGCGQIRCERFLKAMDEKITMTLTSQEIIDEVFDQIGLRINVKEPFDRIERVE